MGNSLIAESKLQFYPTNEFETHRLLGLLGRLKTNPYQKEILKRNLIGEEKYKELFATAYDNGIESEYVLYDYLLKEKNYKGIKDFFKLELGYPDKNNKKVVIADLFAGESRWLQSFHNIMNKGEYSNDSILIANELDEDRFNQFKDNEDIYDKYNKAFEELQLPKNTVSLMLFNPPYGTSNGERNVRRYLRMIIERDLIVRVNKEYTTGYMVFVIRKDDFLDSLDLICKHFDVNKGCIYKTEKEEYEKYKQYIFIARIRKNAYDDNKIQDVADYHNQYNQIKEIIEKEPEFNLMMYSNYRWMNYPSVDYDTAKENFIYVENKEKYISKNNSLWKWIKGNTELKDLSKEQIKLPKNPKWGEISMLIASGMINGEIELKDGEGKHIVVGGTKTITSQEISTSKGLDGKNINTTKTIKLSKPYLNILCTVDGKLTIKELGDE